jgi:hypothetical protein
MHGRDWKKGAELVESRDSRWVGCMCVGMGEGVDGWLGVGGWLGAFILWEGSCVHVPAVRHNAQLPLHVLPASFPLPPGHTAARQPLSPASPPALPLAPRRESRAIASHAQKHFIKMMLEGRELPPKVCESGRGYTLSGKPLDPNSAAARSYGVKPESFKRESNRAARGGAIARRVVLARMGCVQCVLNWCGARPSSPPSLTCSPHALARCVMLPSPCHDFIRFFHSIIDSLGDSGS